MGEHRFKGAVNGGVVIQDLRSQVIFRGGDVQTQHSSGVKDSLYFTEKILCIETVHKCGGRIGKVQEDQIEFSSGVLDEKPAIPHFPDYTGIFENLTVLSGEDRFHYVVYGGIKIDDSYGFYGFLQAFF